MMDNQNNKRKPNKAASAIVILIALMGTVISRAQSCDCNNDFGDDSSDNNSLLVDFDYDFNFDDYDFSIFDNDYEFEEEKLRLRVKQASFDEAAGTITAIIENYGNVSEDGMPALIMKGSKDAEDYICCVYPESYYDGASDSLDVYLGYRTLILPQTEVTLRYKAESYELEYLQEAIAESGEIWVTFYKDTLEETYCLLEIE